tara:strand:- start:8900 stop:9580 length:681 start_codon:yes stop_codon:yes gene_type:complete
MFSIIIPLFNEAKNIDKLIKEINFNLNKYKNYEVILIDDASTDDTFITINKLKSEKIKILKNTKNKGQSYSIYKGISSSLNKIIITLDGDGQNDPKDIPKLLEHYLSQDSIKLIGGIRKKRKDTLIKITSSKIANYVRSQLLKDNCKDTGCSLKVFNRKIFLEFPYFDGIHRFLPALFNGYGYKTKFISVNHRKRKFGVSKYGTLKRLYKGIIDMIRVIKILKNKK